MVTATIFLKRPVWVINSEFITQKKALQLSQKVYENDNNTLLEVQQLAESMLHT